MSGKAIRETLGFVVVVASLVFVGVEIRQNSQSVQAATYQDLIAQITNLNVLEIENPEFGALVQATLDGPSPERPDETQIRQMAPYLWLLLRHGDLAFSQYQRARTMMSAPSLYSASDFRSAVISTAMTT